MTRNHEAPNTFRYSSPDRCSPFGVAVRPVAETDPLWLTISGSAFSFRYPDHHTAKSFQRLWDVVARADRAAGGRVHAFLTLRQSRNVQRLLGPNLLALQVKEVAPDRILYVVQTLIVWVCVGRQAALGFWDEVGRLGAHGLNVPEPPPLALS